MAEKLAALVKGAAEPDDRYSDLCSTGGYATVDGAKRIDIIRYIILPALVVPMTTMFILNLGFFMTAGFDQVFNFTNQSVNSVIDILDTYVYRIGLESGQYSLATAVALIKGIVGVFLVLVTHLVSKKVTGKGVW